MLRSVSILTLALIAGAVFASPARASQAGAQPYVAAPPGWTQQRSAQTQYFLPPGASNGSVYEAVFPMLTLDGSLEQTASEIWHKMIGGEQLVDSKSKTLTADDGSRAYETLVATLDQAHHGVYRVFVVKQYGDAVAAGELRFDDVDRIKAIGKPALDSLLAMSADEQTIQPYRAHEVQPMRGAGVDVAAHQGALPGGLTGIWALKVPGVAYQTSVDYGAYTQRTLHVSAGAAAGYLRITGNKRYVWYDGSGHAVSHGRLVEVVPHNFARPGTHYWRVYEGREEHYLTLDSDGGISIYDAATNMVSMEGTKH